MLKFKKKKEQEHKLELAASQRMTTCEDLVKSPLASSSLHISLLKVSFYMQMGTVNSPTGKNGHFDSNGLFTENKGGRNGVGAL